MRILKDKSDPSRRNLAICCTLAICVGLLVWVNPLKLLRLQEARRAVVEDSPAVTKEALLVLARQYPRSAEIEFLLARTNRKLGNSPQFQKHLQLAAEFGHPQYEIELEQAILDAQLGNVDEAEPILRRELSISDKHTRDICQALVNGYLLNYRFEDASRWLDAWQADYPNDAEPHFSRGTLWQHLLLWNEAVASFEQGINLNPNRADIRIQLAKALSQLHRYDEAIQHFQAALVTDPGNEVALSGLSQSQIAVGSMDRAKATLESLLKLHPNSFAGLVGLAQISLAEGHAAASLEKLEQAYEVQPKNITVRSELASALRQLDRQDEAQAHLDYVETANEVFAEIQELMRQVQANPKLVQPRYKIGSALLEFATEAEGLSWLYSVVQLDPNHPAAHTTLANHFESHGDNKRAAYHRAKLEVNGAQRVSH